MSGRPEDQKADTLESAFWFLDGMPLPNGQAINSTSIRNPWIPSCSYQCRRSVRAGLMADNLPRKQHNPLHRTGKTLRREQCCASGQLAWRIEHLPKSSRLRAWRTV